MASDGKAENQSTDYKPKNILITGGAGFIGSNVVCGLVQKYPEYKIVNFDKLDYCSSLKNLEELEKCENYKFVKAYGAIKRFIHVSTDEVYGEVAKDDDTLHTENSTVLQPSNPYAATKAGAEFLVQAYHKSFQLPTIITRGNNVYGPKQYPEKLIPKFICLLSRKQSCPIHGNGSHKRNFIHVDDVVSAFDTIMHKGHIGGVYNIGTNTEISNLEVAKTLIKLFGYENESEFIKFVEDRPFNDFRYAINFEKLASLGWSAKKTWEEGLKNTMEWYLTRMDSKHWDNLEGALVAHPRRGMENPTPVIPKKN